MLYSFRMGQEESREEKGRKRARQADTLLYSCAWGTDGLLSMSSLFSLSGLSSIQPLHRHSGWVSLQGYSVCLCASVLSVIVSTFGCGLINWRWSDQWADCCTGPLPKTIPLPYQLWCDYIPVKASASDVTKWNHMRWAEFVTNIDYSFFSPWHVEQCSSLPWRDPLFTPVSL